MSIKAVLISVGLLLPAFLFAQTSGTINGEIKDASGAMVSGAVVTLTDKATNATRSDTTNADGLFAFPTLSPGHYSLNVKMAGFKTESVSDIDLKVQQSIRSDFTLQPGQVNESIEVSASEEQLNTNDATVGTVIENKRVVELPLNGRDYLQLVQFSPNVTASFPPSITTRLMASKIPTSTSTSI